MNTIDPVRILRDTCTCCFSSFSDSLTMHPVSQISAPDDKSENESKPIYPAESRLPIIQPAPVPGVPRSTLAVPEEKREMAWPGWQAQGDGHEPLWRWLLGVEVVLTMRSDLDSLATIIDNTYSGC